jgi:uroporphyrinogen-III synthase
MCPAELNPPLAGKRVLVLRAEGQAGEAARLLRDRGAEAVVVPMLVIGPPDDLLLAEQAVVRLAGGMYDWVAFTSANGVERAWDLAIQAGFGVQAFAGVKIAAVGPATAAALGAHALSVRIVASESRGEGLAREMLATGVGGRVLLLRAEVGRDALPGALEAAGCAVDVVAVYRTRAAEGSSGVLRSLFEPLSLDAVLFTSSSTVAHVQEALGDAAASLLGRIRVATIGPVTTETARTHGIFVDVEASPYTLPSLVSALEASFAEKPNPCP